MNIIYCTLTWNWIKPCIYFRWFFSAVELLTLSKIQDLAQISGACVWFTGVLWLMSSQHEVYLKCTNCSLVGNSARKQISKTCNYDNFIFKMRCNLSCELDKHFAWLYLILCETINVFIRVEFENLVPCCGCCGLLQLYDFHEIHFISKSLVTGLQYYFLI